MRLQSSLTLLPFSTLSILQRLLARSAQASSSAAAQALPSSSSATATPTSYLHFLKRKVAVPPETFRWLPQRVEGEEWYYDCEVSRE